MSDEQLRRQGEVIANVNAENRRLRDRVADLESVIAGNPTYTERKKLRKINAAAGTRKCRDILRLVKLGRAVETCDLSYEPSQYDWEEIGRKAQLLDIYRRAGLESPDV